MEKIASFRGFPRPRGRCCRRRNTSNEHGLGATTRADHLDFVLSAF